MNKYRKHPFFWTAQSPGPGPTFHWGPNTSRILSTKSILVKMVLGRGLLEPLVRELLTEISKKSIVLLYSKWKKELHVELYILYIDVLLLHSSTLLKILKNLTSTTAGPEGHGIQRRRHRIRICLLVAGGALEDLGRPTIWNSNFFSFWVFLECFLGFSGCFWSVC